ncbi:MULTISPECIES: glutathione S-transferase family protein [Ramlibacter]|uniref:Glutathione S-transferase family protein n=1 Tax=Ramlibacter pinisoli TaxID=2682844 RepID=A0A6N8J3P5_9BURK|nr:MULTISPECIES: glutathione S-transferase family protein [Ramlibacter]MBA2962893.1 glutathione S-transferase family protein [Ramlibacter sp. CGMCC 1.13660]MVQ32836.1 glutathione S-transferase family protein [Ramlibacter pinisoli]
MTLKLYFAPGACSFVPHTLLEASGAAFEPVLVKLHKGEQNAPEYRALNPHGQVPVLVDGDAVITQILAIVGYLDAKFPQLGLLPQEPLARARVMETLAWMNNTVHPTFTHVFMPFKYSDKPDVQAELKAYNAQLYRPLLQEIEALVQAAVAQGRPFLGGPQFGPLDAYALTLLRWGGFAGIDPKGFPAAWAHVQKVAQLPPVARAIARERLQLDLTQAG